MCRPVVSGYVYEPGVLEFFRHGPAIFLLIARWRLAGGEVRAQESQTFIYLPCGRVRAPEHAPRDPICVLERLHGLAPVIERGAGLPVERQRVIPPHPEREFITLAENALRYGRYFTQQRFRFSVASLTAKVHWIGCFYRTILGAEGMLPTGAAYPGGMPYDALAQAWEAPFVSEDPARGGCPAVAVHATASRLWRPGRSAVARRP